jgi:hypothetical protein
MGIAAWMTLSVGAQTNSVSFYVDGARPVAEAILSLTDRYPVVITYEDPRFEYSGDIKDVTVDEPARDVLLRVLHSISPSLSWRTFCSPGDDFCFVNLAVAKGMLIEPPIVLPRALPAPQPGDPTPAFRLDTLPPERR